MRRAPNGGQTPSPPPPSCPVQACTLFGPSGQGRVQLPRWQVFLDLPGFAAPQPTAKEAQAASSLQYSCSGLGDRTCRIGSTSVISMGDRQGRQRPRGSPPQTPQGKAQPGLEGTALLRPLRAHPRPHRRPPPRKPLGGWGLREPHRPRRQVCWSSLRL